MIERKFGFFWRVGAFLAMLLLVAPAIVRGILTIGAYALITFPSDASEICSGFHYAFEVQFTGDGVLCSVVPHAIADEVFGFVEPKPPVACEASAGISCWF